jgi:hopanoid-associated phosphorylase
MIGILCGLESEARIARKVQGAHIACAGARPAKARVLAKELAAKKVQGLISFGVAGALDSDLPPGSLVIGTQVMNDTHSWTCDEAWGKRLVAALPGARLGGVWGSEVLIPSAAEKMALHQQSGCLIVDMESQCLAAAAYAAGIPFTVVRAVCDHANRELPMLIMAFITPDGGVSLPKAITGLLRQPRHIPALLHFALDMEKAKKALRQAVARLV